MTFYAQVEDENKKLREQLFKRKSSFETLRKMENRALFRPLTANHPGGRIARVTLRSLVRALRGSAASEVSSGSSEGSSGTLRQPRREVKREEKREVSLEKEEVSLEKEEVSLEKEEVSGVR